jgi:hypothetical protein
MTEEKWYLSKSRGFAILIMIAIFVSIFLMGYLLGKG